MNDKSDHWVFDSDLNMKNGFFGGTKLESCDSMPAKRGKGVEFWRSDLAEHDSKKFHWNPGIEMKCSTAVSTPTCGATPAPTAKPTKPPTKEPTQPPTPKPTRKKVVFKKKVGSAR